MDKQPHQVTIVGAGIIGIACALQLQKQGCHVTVIDREDPGEGCSKGNAGIFAYEAILPLISPGLLPKLPAMLLDPLSPLAIDWRHLPFMLPWMLRFLNNARPYRVARNTAHLASLLLEARVAYRPLLQQSGATNLVRETGWMTVYETERAYCSDARGRQVQREHGIRVEAVDAAALHDLLPGLYPGVRHGVYYPDACFTTDPHRLVRRLAKQVCANGGQVCRDEAQAIKFENEQIRLITATGNRHCERLLVAAGVWSKQLARAAGDRFPLDTERGYHLMLSRPGIDPAMPVMSGEHHFVTTPMETGLRLAGTSELAGLTRPPNYARAEGLLQHARRLWPGLQGEGDTRWMGFRPTLPDSLPVLGPSPAVPGLYYAFGHQHLGLTLAAISGKLMAEMISGKPAAIDMTPYRADRF